MRWSGLWAAAVLLCSGVPAHAQYDIRLGELRPEIQAFGQPALVQSIQGNVENEFEQRNDALEEAREDFLQAEGPQPLHEQWLAFHQQQAEQRTKNFEGFYAAAEDIIERDGLGGQGLHPALLWIARVRQEQFAFQIAIKGMPLAQLRDLLEAKTDLYTQALSNMEKEQSTLESNANSAASSARSYRQALLTACTDLRRIKTEAERDLGRVSTEIVPGLTPDQAEDFRDGLQRQIDRLIGDIQLFQSRANVALDQIQGIDGQAMAIAKIVLAKRQAVQTVRNNFNLGIAETQFALQLDAARNQIDQIKPDGDKKDLEAYVGNAEDDLEPALERFKEAEEEFADRFEGIFVPPYNDFEQRALGPVRRMGGLGRRHRGLRGARSAGESRDLCGAPVGRAPGQITDPQAREIVEDALEAQADRLIDAIDAALAEATRLNQAAQLSERQVLRDELNRS